MLAVVCRQPSVRPRQGHCGDAAGGGSGQGQRCPTDRWIPADVAVRWNSARHAPDFDTERGTDCVAATRAAVTCSEKAAPGETFVCRSWVGARETVGFLRSFKWACQTASDRFPSPLNSAVSGPYARPARVRASPGRTGCARAQVVAVIEMGRHGVGTDTDGVRVRWVTRRTVTQSDLRLARRLKVGTEHHGKTGAERDRSERHPRVGPFCHGDLLHKTRIRRAASRVY